MSRPNKKKVGIITHYYKSQNYGGVLQAYALCRFLQQCGFEAEQICFPLVPSALPWIKIPKQLDKRIIYYLKQGTLVKNITAKLRAGLQAALMRILLPTLKDDRTASFSNFTQNRIPHSTEVYSGQTIHQCIDHYDAFVTGSDQVWNLRWYDPAFFLTFVPSEKQKISYGASMSMAELSEQEQALMRTHLQDFSAISVRERQTAQSLSKITGKTVEWVLDPTMLLNTEHWNEVCADQMIQEPYLFCYFLNKDRAKRRLAKKYARRKNLKIVTIPHLNGKYVMNDVGFGDIRLEAPTPEEFISLIRHASCIFTDSFHANVFSHMYHKEYYVFRRDHRKGMDMRISSLLELFGTQSRFCNTSEKMKLKYILGLEVLDHSKHFKEFHSLRESSAAFLIHNLNIALGYVKQNETESN